MTHGVCVNKLVLGTSYLAPFYYKYFTIIIILTIDVINSRLEAFPKLEVHPQCRDHLWYAFLAYTQITSFLEEVVN